MLGKHPYVPCRKRQFIAQEILNAKKDGKPLEVTCDKMLALCTADVECAAMSGLCGWAGDGPRQCQASLLVNVGVPVSSAASLMLFPHASMGCSCCSSPIAKVVEAKQQPATAGASPH